MAIDGAALRTWLRYGSGERFDDDSADLAIKVAAGWLVPEIGAVDPASLEPTDAPVYGWVIELAGIAYENPSSLSTDESGEQKAAWQDRRAQILSSARAWGTRQAQPESNLGGPLPRATFPEAARWPE